MNVSASPLTPLPATATVGEINLISKRVSTSDSARLLADVPGVSRSIYLGLNVKF